MKTFVKPLVVAALSLAVAAPVMANGSNGDWENGHKLKLLFNHDWEWNEGPVCEIPEPETYAMLLAGLGMLGVVGRRRMKNRPPEESEKDPTERDA